MCIRGRPEDDWVPPLLLPSPLQAFHALRSVDEVAYLRLLHQSLRPGGVLMLLVGNANEPAVGPAVLTQQVRCLAGQYSMSVV